MYSIRQLKVFLTVAETSSFAEAAKLLHQTSAALSAAVKSLEAGVGFKVFERTTRAVTLTAEGKRLLEAARSVIRQHDEFLFVVDSVQRQKTGLVRVVSTQLIGCTVLPPRITTFHRLHPDIEIVVVPALYDDFDDLIRRKEVDIGIGPERLCDEDTLAEPLFNSRLHLICSKRHRFAKLTEVQWKDLVQERVFLIDKRGSMVLERSADYQVSFARTLDVGHFSTALALASEGEGIMIAPALTEMLLQPYELAMIPLIQPSSNRTFMLYRAAKPALTREAALFTEHLKQSW